MKKAAQLQVTLTMDGPGPATASPQAVMASLQKMLSQVAGKYPALTVTVKSIKKEGSPTSAAPAGTPSAPQPGSARPTAPARQAKATGKAAKPTPSKAAKSAPSPLHLRLWVAGEDEPAHNFAASSIQAVQDMLSQVQAQAAPVKIKVQSVEEDANYDDEDDWIASDTGA